MKLLANGLISFFAFLAWLVPVRFQFGLGKILGILWFDILRIRRGLVLDNIKRAFPDWPEEKCIRVGRTSMSVVGQSIVDVFLVAGMNKERARKCFEITGRENIERAFEKKKGVICLSMHVGRGDAGTAALSLDGFPINLITKEFKSVWLNDIWFRVREKHGTRLLGARKSQFEIFKALKRNEIVIFVNDQFMGPPLGVRTQFFGQETGTAFGLALIAGRKEVPVVPCYTYMEKNGKSKVVFGPEIPFVHKSTHEETMQYMSQKYTDCIEEIVREHPEQWLWVHRRWKEFKD